MVDGTTDSAYQKQRKGNVQPSVQGLNLQRIGVLQQDNDPKHGREYTSDWLKQMKSLEQPRQRI